MKFRSALLLTLLLGFASERAAAYSVLGYSWTRNRTVLMQLSLPQSGPLSDGLTFQQSAEDALKTWNQYLVHMQFAWVENSPVPPSNSDADNSVIFSNTVFGDAFGGSTLAVTLQSMRGNVTEEADVVFNNALDFDSYRGPTRFANGSTVYDFHRIALHEFGHVVGLDHPDEHGQTVTAIMNSRVSNIDALQPDDISGGQSIYNTGPPYLNSVPASAFANLSTRAFVGTGEAVMIGGFIVQGSQPATMVLRGIGHSLRARGITAPLNDPVIELRGADGRVIASSDDWISSSTDVNQPNPDATTIASYHLDPPNSRESALIATLQPGSYTVQVHAYDNGDGDLTGTGLIELYDVHTTGGRAGNISTRGQVLGADNVLIGGFIIGGQTMKGVVARGLGPSLSAAGVASPLSDPVIEVRDSSGNLLAQNDNWRDGADASQIQSEGLAPGNDSESAVQLTLRPGSYTAIVRGSGGATGIGLVELYDLSTAPQ